MVCNRLKNAFRKSGHKTQLQFNDIYGYFRKTKTPGLPQWLENDDATPRSKDTNDINYTSCKYRTVRSELGWGRYTGNVKHDEH